MRSSPTTMSSHSTGSVGQGRDHRHRLSRSARAAGAAGRSTRRMRTCARAIDCLVSPARRLVRRPARRIWNPGELGLSELAAAALWLDAIRRKPSSRRLTRQRRDAWRIAFSSSTTTATSARSSASRSKKAGMDVIEARDGKEALTALRRRQARSDRARHRHARIRRARSLPRRSARPPTCRSCSCRRATRRSIACSASRSAATIT